MQSNQSGIDHYVSAYPRRLYTGQGAESSLPFASVPLLDAVDADLERLRTQRVALIFDNVARPDTTGIYCLRALRSIARVTHVQPSGLAALNRGDFDLYLYIDDGLEYPLRPDLHPSALWAIDTHIMPERLLRRAGAADYVFAAQRDGAVLLRGHGINCVAWMPLACDPDIHCRHAVPKELDVCFVGHLSTPGRQELAALIRQKFSNSFVGQRFFAEMAQTYSSSRIVLNLSIRNDVNMRVFEALACGSLLITNDLRNNGLGELFDVHKHLAVYHDIQELVALIQRYVSNEPLREKIAAAGRKEALAYHTYAHRMRAVLSQVARGAGVHFDRKSATGSTENTPQYDRAEYRVTSIIILTRDQLVFTRQCLDSIRRHVRVPCEIIVVDNGSTDGTVEYLCAADDVHLIANPDNVGFAAGVNQGIAASKGDQILLLNNDAVLTPSCVERMLRALHSDHTIGIVGPCSNNVPGPQKIVTDYDFSALDVFAGDVAAACDSRIQDVSVLVGFCMLMRREVVNHIGLFDESFGIGTYEDYDYCLRALKAGYRLAVARDAFVHHFGSMTLKAMALDVQALLCANQGIFATKWRGQLSALLKLPRRPDRGMTSIVIVTRNQATYTRLCIESILRHTAAPYEIIVVDNGSTDGTVEYLKSVRTLRVMENQTNIGFPAAANQGIRACRGQQILLLNNDVIVTPNWLGRLLAALDRDPKAALVGPVTNCASGPQQVPVEYSDLEGLDTFAQRHAQRYADQVTYFPRLVGFCLLLRCELVDRIGLLDERFGIGNFEDDDYCRRTQEAGFLAVIAKDCFVHHFGSATFRSSEVDYPALLAHNRRLYEEKWRDVTPTNSSRDERVPLILTKPNADIAPGTRPQLSLCMIVRDSSRTLGACLQSAKPWVDEIIIVDTGSVDDTIDIARRYGARIAEFPWCDDFSAARNASVKEARGEWIFWMDSDDTIDAANGQKLRNLVGHSHPSANMGFILQVHCPGSATAGPYATATVVDHVKVFRNIPGIEFSGRIHEQVLPAIRRLGGEVAWTDIFVVHSGSDITPEGRIRKHDRDLRILKLELSDEPDSTFTLFNIGMTLLDANRPEEALNFLCRSLQLAISGESHLRKLYALIVQAYTELGRRSTALGSCVQGLRVCPGDPELLFRKGTLEQSLGDLAAAEQSYRLLAQSPHDRHFSSVDRGILGIKCWHNLAILYHQRADHAAAAEAWRRVLEFDRQNRIAWRGLMDALASSADCVGLQRLCEELRDSGLSTDMATIGQARLLELRGQPREALEQLKCAMTASGSTEVLHELCALTFTHQFHDEAEPWLEELAHRFPEDPAAHHNLAALYFHKREHHKAVKSAQRSLELRPNHPDTRRILNMAFTEGLATNID